MPDQDFLEDQTPFAEEEPLHTVQQKKSATQENAGVKKPPFLVYVSAIIFLILIMTVGFAAMIRNQRQQPVIPTVTITPSPVLQNSSQIDQIMLELRFAIDNADPATTSLPFPPVADRIRISQ